MSKQRKRTDGLEPAPYQGKRGRTTETKERMAQAAITLRWHPLISVNELAELEGWERGAASYILDALWDDGAIARVRARDTNAIGVHGNTWLHQRVPGVTVRMLRAA